MRATALAGIALGAALVSGSVATTRWLRPTPLIERNPLGDTIPSLMLKTPGGSAQDLRARLGGKPAVIYVFNQAECLGCSDLPLEFRVIRAQGRGVEPLLIGSGSPPAAFAQSLHDMHLESSALIDEDRTVLKALGLTHEPLVILVGADGRILVVDTRNTSRAALHPMGQIIHDLESVFAPFTRTKR